MPEWWRYPLVEVNCFEAQLKIFYEIFLSDLLKWRETDKSVFCQTARTVKDIKAFQPFDQIISHDVNIRQGVKIIMFQVAFQQRQILKSRRIRL